MKVGQLVKHYVPKIIAYCIEHDRDEIDRLQDTHYSKTMFGISWPFWSPLNKIEESKRFWIKPYQVEDQIFRASSQWYIQNMQPFISYLIEKGIATQEEVESLEVELEKEEDAVIEKRITTSSRYKSSAIGNAQNLLIRNILSNLGEESFTEQDWEETKKFFEYKCAYCGETDKKLIMEHAIPINKVKLGEHKLGNLVPSCHACNQQKAAQRYDEFLENRPDKLQKIEEYMQYREYTPLHLKESSYMIEEVLEVAYRDVSEVAKRYIKIIEALNAV